MVHQGDRPDPQKQREAQAGSVGPETRGLVDQHSGGVRPAPAELWWGKRGKQEGTKYLGTRQIGAKHQ